MFYGLLLGILALTIYTTIKVKLPHKNRKIFTHQCFPGHNRIGGALMQIFGTFLVWPDAKSQTWSFGYLVPGVPTGAGAPCWVLGASSWCSGVSSTLIAHQEYQVVKSWIKRRQQCCDKAACENTKCLIFQLLQVWWADGDPITRFWKSVMLDSCAFHCWTTLEHRKGENI